MLGLYHYSLLYLQDREMQLQEIMNNVDKQVLRNYTDAIARGNKVEISRTGREVDRRALACVNSSKKILEVLVRKH